MTLVDLVRGLKGRKQAAVESYAATVARVADDGKVPLEVLERVLTAAGKTPEDFESDVQRQRRRREALQKIREAETCDEERKTLTKRLDAAKAILNAAHAEYDEVANGVAVGMIVVREREEQAREGRRYLEESADPRLVEQVAQAEGFAREVGGDVAQARNYLDQCVHAVEATEQRLADVRAGRADLVKRGGYIGPETTEPECQRQLDAAMQRRDAARERVKAAELAVAQAQDIIARLRESMLVV